MTILVSSGTPGLLIFGFIAVFVIVVIVGARQAIKRRNELQALAARLGWQFDSSADYSFDSSHGHFDIFTRGHDRHAFNLLSGTVTAWGRPVRVVMGDYQYETESGSGKDRRTDQHHFSFLIAGLPINNTPALSIRTEGLLDKIAGALGFDDINFESEQFSRAFHVKCDDRKFAFDVIDPRMMEFLLETKPKGLSIRGGEMCLSDGSRRWNVEEFEASVRFTVDFLNHWPAHVQDSLMQGTGSVNS